LEQTLLDYTIRDMTQLLRENYGKGEYHGKGLFTHIYKTGGLEGLKDSPCFKENPALAEKIRQDFPLNLPFEAGEFREEGTIKTLLRFYDGEMAESVFIPMEGHNTLCLSSQIGCARGCTFCRTASMGLIRNLSSGEIVSQVMHHIFVKKRKIRNIVFMGMGEPFDNFDRVIKAVDILSDPRGLSIKKRFISLSTCGHVDGLKRLARLIGEKREEHYSALRLAVSVNASCDKKRNKIMPVNKIWPLNELKKTLKALPQSLEKDRLYFEYVLIEGVNDSRKDADNLLSFFRWIGR
jgi:23S rRNA (adenine2503-C2)-methyltransferase